jgi:hypothetical protein
MHTRTHTLTHVSHLLAPPTRLQSLLNERVVVAGPGVALVDHHACQSHKHKHKGKHVYVWQENAYTHTYTHTLTTLTLKHIVIVVLRSLHSWLLCVFLFFRHSGLLFCPLSLLSVALLLLLRAREA